MNTKQTDFFDVFGEQQMVQKPVKLARDSDPQTSQVGAKYIAQHLGAKQLEFLRRLKAIGKPSTANEVANGDESVRKRAKELARAGEIVACGERACGRTGHRAETYWIPE